MFKGWIGEQKTEFNLRFSLDKKLYRRFHDVIIPSSNGTTQVDHILVSPFGLFIVETKNKMGWIYGSESQSKWTQVIYGKKYSFQNPLRQTHRHKKVLSKFLDLNESNIETIVYFNGDSTFKTELPSNVLSYGLGSYIQQFQDTILSNDEIERICGLLISNEGKINGIGGDRRCDYVVKVDKDGWVQSIVIMTERNCGFVLKLLLEMVRQ